MGIPTFMKNMVVHKFESTIRNLVKEKRLEFQANDMVRYTDRERVVREVNYSEMAAILIGKAGYDTELEAQFGISNQIIVNMLVTERNKLEAKKNEV